MNNKEIKEIVDKYPVENFFGFTEIELRSMLELYFPDIDISTLALGTNTVTILADGRIVRYHCDIEMAIRLHYAKNESINKYMMRVGIRSTEFTFSDELLYDNVDYFKRCQQQGLSAYKALTFFHSYLNGEYKI